MICVVSYSFHICLAFFRHEIRKEVDLHNTQPVSRSNVSQLQKPHKDEANTSSRVLNTYHNNPIHCPPSLVPIHTQPLQHEIGHIPRHIPYAPRTAVTPYNGRAGQIESLEGGGVGDVGDVDEHAEAIHFVD